MFADLKIVAFHVLSTHVAHTSSGAGCGRASGLTKRLICPKPGQNSWKSSHKFRSRLFEFKKWQATFAENHKKTFLGGHTKKTSSRPLLEKICRHKSTKNLFRQVWKKLDKNPSHPQKFACSYTCALKRFSIDYFRHFLHFCLHITLNSSAASIVEHRNWRMVNRKRNAAQPNLTHLEGERSTMPYKAPNSAPGQATICRELP